jgi:hypothetical protein
VVRSAFVSVLGHDLLQVPNVHSHAQALVPQLCVMSAEHTHTHTHIPLCLGAQLYQQDL